MRKISFLFVIVATLSMSQVVHATKNDMNLAPVVEGNIERCVPVEASWKSLNLVATKHKGADESVGVIKKKGVLEKIFVTNDIKKVVSDSVRNTLQRCGYKFSDKADSLQLTIVIDDFFTKSANEGLVGKDTTTISLKLQLKVPGRAQDYQVQYGIEKSAKSPPFAKAKRFQKILNAALIDVMNQIAMSQTLAGTVKAVSKEITAAPQDETKYFEEGR